MSSIGRHLDDRLFDGSENTKNCLGTAAPPNKTRANTKCQDDDLSPIKHETFIQILTPYHLHLPLLQNYLYLMIYLS